MKRRIPLPQAALIAAVIFADTASKEWALAVLKDAEPIVVAPILRLVYVENTGVAFGLLAGGSRWLLVALALGLSAFLVYYMRQAANAAEKWGCALMLSGAIGNMADRVRFGYVVDFIDAHVAGYHWPAFNVADISISCGAMLFIYAMLRAKR